LAAQAAFLTRELFVSDGATLLSALTVSVKLANAVDDIDAAHKAIKWGGGLGIGQGVVETDNEQKALLFEPGCFNKDCGASSVNPPATRNGLEALLHAFLNSIQKVMPPPPPHATRSQPQT
jgi:hypothetical protein